MQLTGDFKLTIGVNIRVNGYVSPCVSPATDWQHVQGLPRLSSYDSLYRLQSPATLN